MNSAGVSVTQLSGLVKGFISNKHGDIDVVELDTSNGVIKLHFPPHTAKKVIDKIAVGQQVIADYTVKERPEKKPVLELESIRKDQRDEILLINDKKQEKIKGGSPVETIKSENFTLIRGKKGEPVSILVDNKLVHFHKKDRELAAAVQPDSVLTIQANLRTDEGFVNEHNLPVYHIKSITVDGQSILPSKKK
jgi:hypothetical protein